MIDIIQLESNRKRQFYFICCGLFMPIIAGFAMVDYFEGDTVEMAVDLFIFVLMALTLPAILVLKRERMTYRVGLVLNSLAILINVSIGGGNETILFWILIIPMVIFFFLEKREGTLLIAIFSLLLLILLLGGEQLGTHVYSISSSGRFIVAYLFLTLISYGLEASRFRAAHQVLAQNETLEVEKERLEGALAEIKTLSGMLPICASCKKVRADSGYWHQIEEYITDHSEARFSHGICPDCLERLYPELPPEEDESAG